MRAWNCDDCKKWEMQERPAGHWLPEEDQVQIGDWAGLVWHLGHGSLWGYLSRQGVQRYVGHPCTPFGWERVHN